MAKLERWERSQRQHAIALRPDVQLANRLGRAQRQAINEGVTLTPVDLEAITAGASYRDRYPRVVQLEQRRARERHA